MFAIIGMVVVLASVIGGFTIAGGKIMALFHVSEIVTILGTALGTVLISTPVPVIKGMIGKLVGVLKGAMPFMSDLMRAIALPVDIDFMAVSSYGAATKSSGVVRIVKDLDADLTDRHVLVVEDVIDSGLTLSYLRKYLGARKPASLEVCALLYKETAQRVEQTIRYVGFSIPPDFVVGYGLDANERYRNLGGVYQYTGAL